MLSRVARLFRRPTVETRASSEASSEAVLWAYRLILGREPTPAEVNAHAGFHDLNQLRRAFFESEEFALRERHLCGPSLSGMEPRLPIQDEVEEAVLEKLLAHVQASWEQFGREEPHWSVLTTEDFKQANLDANRERFYQTGVESAELFLNLLRRNGCFPEGVVNKTVLEYGCGVGRVTHALARHFKRVYACDISAPHLELARQFTESLGLRNIEFTQIRHPHDAARFPQVDAVYTLIVLQHNPPPIIRIILNGLLEALAPGGVAFFQLLTYQRGYSFIAEEYLRGVATRGAQIEMHPLPQPRVFEIVAQRNCRVLEVLDDPLAGYHRGELSNMFIVQKSER